jgi:hypothetical protein
MVCRTQKSVNPGLPWMRSDGGTHVRLHFVPYCQIGRGDLGAAFQLRQNKDTPLAIRRVFVQSSAFLNDFPQSGSYTAESAHRPMIINELRT